MLQRCRNVKTEKNYLFMYLFIYLFVLLQMHCPIALDLSLNSDFNIYLTGIAEMLKIIYLFISPSDIFSKLSQTWFVHLTFTFYQHQWLIISIIFKRNTDL